MTIIYASGDGRFATRADLARYGLPSSVLAGISVSDQDDALTVATAEIGDLIADRVTLPLSEWTPTLRMHTCRAAAYHLLRVNGFNQDSSDEMVREDYRAALGWAKAAQSGQITPQLVDATPSESEKQTFVRSNPRRRWLR